MRRALLPLLPAALLLSGCAMSGEQISSAATPALVELAEQDAMTTRWTLLGSLGKRRVEVIDELVLRGEITPREAASIKAGDLFVGMRAAAVKLVLGPPHRITHLSAATSDAESFHYTAPGFGSAEVRLRGGKVVSWALP
jgi:hypothetical protein